MEGVEKFYFKSPSTVLVAGPTSSGKTHLLFEILKHKTELFEKKVDKIIWCYTAHQRVFVDYPEITFHKGLYDITKVDSREHTVVVLDDLMHRLDRSVAETFTIHSHHNNVTVFFLVQNLFFQNKFMRDIALNTQYLVLFAQKRDVSQVGVLATQMFPQERKEFLEVYKQATSESYGYLLCDLHPRTKYRALLRTHILPHEIDIVYIPE